MAILSEGNREARVHWSFYLAFMLSVAELLPLSSKKFYLALFLDCCKKWPVRDAVLDASDKICKFT
eukprot:scaffold57280_cov42-Cyclotella_meneghiniana.AAC.1